MKKPFGYPMILLTLISFSFLSACSSPSNIPTLKTESPSPTIMTATTDILTIEDIKQMYTDSQILNITNINDDHVLIESQLEGSANRFDLYNLKTGEADNLPTMPEYATLKNVISENFFIFEATGKNSESSFVSFPYIKKCFRVSSDVNRQDNFNAINEAEYYALDRSVQAGSKKNSVLSEINETFSGLEVMFKPDNGKDMEFYADFADIPPTKTFYDSKTNKLTLEMNTNLLSNKIKNNVGNEIEDHYYVSSYKITQKDNKSYIEIYLKNNVKSYSITTEVDGYPYFLIQFSDLDSTSFDH
ncbi:MAG: hypothetical protein VB064_05375 [Oscillospiraceae bacterium]|nr:hypothetical protein [Oscillospiraceae bacterium]